MGLPYTAIFSNYENIFDQLQSEYNYRYDLKR